MALACKTLANLKFKQGSSLLKNSSVFQGTKRGLQTESFIQKARRLKERRETKFSNPEDTIAIGSEVYGLNSAVNWSFVEHGIVPEQKAFRNLNLRRSIGFASGKADKEKTISVEIKNTDFPKYAVGENLSEAQFDALYKQATLRMGEDKDVFMQDGAVGSHRWAEVKTRVLTDDGNTALLAKHLLTPTKIYKDPRDYRFEAVIIATSHLALRNPGDFGLKSGPFIAVNRKTKRAIIGGAPSSATLIDAIGDIASNALLSKLPSQTVSFDSTAYSAIELMEKQKLQEVAVVDANKNVIGVLSLKHVANILNSVEEGTYDEFTPLDSFLLPLREQAVPLSGDAILHSDKKNTTVVVSHNGHFLQTKPSFSLFGAHNIFWSTSGLVHAWQGVNYPHGDSVKLSKGNVIEKLPNNKAQSTVPLNVPNAVNHPQNIVFLVSDTKSALPTIGKLDSTQASQFFTAGYNGNSFQPFFSSALSTYSNPAELTQFFKKQVEEKKPNVFVVNSAFRNKEMSSQDLHKVISAIVDGSASKASSSKGGAFSALNSVQGVANLESGNSSKLEQEMSAFLKSKFPNVTF